MRGEADWSKSFSSKYNGCLKQELKFKIKKSL